ncbi:hypothetical protein G7Y79_00053g088340 [Physcia stellaris]|nr:hypothetical protein G7Y79_00053g088340 [Physcia stellaris]
MNSSNYRRPGAFSPRTPTSPNIPPSRPSTADPSESDTSSSSSQQTSLSAQKQPRSPHQTQTPRPPVFSAASSNVSSASVNNFSRPSLSHANSELPLRNQSPLGPELQRHRRQHSQGFFEPSLPSTQSDTGAMGKLTASQIAAQAAMLQQSTSQHVRKRSQTVPSPQSPPEPAGGRRKPQPIQTTTDAARKPSGGVGAPGQQYSNGSVGGPTAAATTAANAAFPRSAQLSPGLTNFDLPAEKEHKLKSERSKMKLFSKPKQLTLSSNKEVDQKDKPLPSPNKMGPPGPSGLSRMINPSVTSLADSASNAPSIYSSANASTSTLIPIDRQIMGERDKGHKHHFLSRQKNKLRDRMDDHTLPLSSASSNSRPVDPSAPQSLYSFAPASPGPSASSFAKSVSGLDLRHGGRALREKKKEEKASAANPSFDTRRPDTERSDWALPATQGSSSYAFLGPTGTGGPAVFGGGASGSYGAELPTQASLQGFGISNMSAEDAWDFLKAKLLIIFEGEQLRSPVEDLNRLVSIHIQRCILKRTPATITEDLRDLAQTGFISLDQTLRGVPDSRLVPHLASMWLFVYGKVLPYMQAVFLPLDLEFKGHGTLMTSQEAAEFWGASLESTDDAFGNEFDVRRMVLVSYRDNVILPRHDSLKAIFSRLSLDNAGVSLVNESPEGGFVRPGTAGSLDPGFASYNSQGSTVFGDAAGTRSRATSNLSAPELPPFGSPNVRRQAPPDSSKVTETVGRMLQCVSVLASVQSGDDPQRKMEGLAKELKLNWLGRGRTGRNRKGFVGTRINPTSHGSSRHQVDQTEGRTVSVA